MMDSQGVKAKGILLELIVFSDNILNKRCCTFIFKDHTHLNFPIGTVNIALEGLK